MERTINVDDTRRKVVVLDASAFIAGYDPFSVRFQQYSVPSVRDELQKNSLSRLRFEAASERGRLKILKPKPRFLERVRKASIDVGDLSFLSEADLEILALALQLKDLGYVPSIITDDYSIQNVAEKIKVAFTSLATLGIRFQLKWIRYCPACHRRYPTDYKSTTCEVCGATLKRKPLKRTKIR